MGIFDASFKQVEKSFRNLKTGQPIEQAYVSPLASGSQTERYGPGFGNAVRLLLTNSAEFHRNTLDDILITYPSSDGKTTVRIHSKKSAFGRTWITNSFDHGAAAPLLALAECLLLGLYPNIRKAIQTLAAETHYPILPAQLHDFTSDTHSVGLVHSVANNIYHEINQAAQRKTINLQASTNGPLSFSLSDAVPPSFIAAALGVTSGKQGVNAHASPLERLKRIARRGGAALLIGPPGTFKTETVKRLALETNANVVKMRGAPGVEDRDFIGCIMPQPEGPVWVDGPLPTAFTLARSGKTILHIDEILRYHYIHLNVLVGAMDELSAQDIKAVLAPPLRAALLADGHTPEQTEELIDKRLLNETPDPNGRYYMLGLPGGDTLICPKKNLLFAMTTNMGEDNLQTSQDIDAALLSRIHMIIEYARPDVEIVLPIYEKVAKGNTTLANLAYELESATHEMLQDDNSTLARALDPRKTIALIEDAAALLDDGVPLQDAIAEAAFLTAIPHCVSRDARGQLEQTACDALLGRIRRVAGKGAAQVGV